jgi:centromere protein C
MAVQRRLKLQIESVQVRLLPIQPQLLNVLYLLVESPKGIRRSERHRYRPLEWWRQEKVVYGKCESRTFVPHIKSILRIPKEAPVPLEKQNRKRRRTKPQIKAETMVAEPPMVYNPEQGLDDQTPQHGTVMDFITKEEVERRQLFSLISRPWPDTTLTGIAFTAKMVEPQAVANNDWFFQPIFSDSNLMAAGQLMMPPKSYKPAKSSGHNTYVSLLGYTHTHGED